jgi:hypothetical protein
LKNLQQNQVLDSKIKKRCSIDRYRQYLQGLRKRQQNELSRLKAFLNDYCQAYSNKDLDKFITFFAPDATENNKPFQEKLPSYREHMETMESLTYRIELKSFSKQTASENITVRGKFFTRFQVQKGGWEENNGDILMELTKNGDSFLVRQISY